MTLTLTEPEGLGHPRAPEICWGLDGVPRHLCSRLFGNEWGGGFRSRIDTDRHGTTL
jgi:hypothetical protein